HDNEMIVFKSEQKYLRRLEIITSKDVPLMQSRKNVSGPRVPSQSDNSIYNLYTISKDASESTNST
ncbi:unnamed protein product, partial [Rotaria sp. Silwood1]